MPLSRRAVYFVQFTELGDVFAVRIRRQNGNFSRFVITGNSGKRMPARAMGFCVLRLRSVRSVLIGFVPEMRHSSSSLTSLEMTLIVRFSESSLSALPNE